MINESNNNPKGHRDEWIKGTLWHGRNRLCVFSWWIRVTTRISVVDTVCSLIVTHCNYITVISSSFSSDAIGFVSKDINRLWESLHARLWRLCFFFADICELGIYTGTNILSIYDNITQSCAAFKTTAVLVEIALILPLSRWALFLFTTFYPIRIIIFLHYKNYSYSVTNANTA